MAPLHSDEEDACLQVAVDLLERSDAYAAIEPRLARQYARQAYELGQHSQRLRQSIVQERVRMIVLHSDRHRIARMRDAVPLSKDGQLRRVNKAGLMILILLAASLLHSTPVSELPDRRVEIATRFVNAPF